MTSPTKQKNEYKLQFWNNIDFNILGNRSPGKFRCTTLLLNGRFLVQSGPFIMYYCSKLFKGSEILIHRNWFAKIIFIKINPWWGILLSWDEFCTWTNLTKSKFILRHFIIRWLSIFWWIGFGESGGQPISGKYVFGEAEFQWNQYVTIFRTHGRDLLMPHQITNWLLSKIEHSAVDTRSIWIFQKSVSVDNFCPLAFLKTNRDGENIEHEVTS